MSEPGTTIWEKLGASSGMWAVLWLGIQYLLLSGAAADPSASDAEYVRAIIAERTVWESATLLRVVAGLSIIWFMGSLAGRLRFAEGEPGRLATIANATGSVWGATWLLSALFNSASILMATTYNDPAGSRLAGIMSRETPFILTPSILFVLTLATAFVALRFGGFPRPYTYATAILSLALLGLGIVDWYGPGTLSGVIMAIALAWTAITSALLIPAYLPPDLVRGNR